MRFRYVGERQFPHLVSRDRKAVAIVALSHSGGGARVVLHTDKYARSAELKIGSDFFEWCVMCLLLLVSVTSALQRVPSYFCHKRARMSTCISQLGHVYWL